MQSVDIVDVISEHVTLQKKGSLYWCCCPFHSERTPSMAVSKARGTFTCYGCGAHGDAVEFLQKLDNLSFPEAIERLAKKSGIQIMHDHRERTDEEIEASKHRESLLAAIAVAQDFFVSQLQADTSEADAARNYAYGRWGEEYCKSVGIGYAPDSWDALPEYCRSRGVDYAHLKDAGIVKFSDKSRKYYSFFRGRITIPICDRYGKIISYTARYFGDNPDETKYLNTANTPVFEKGNTIFGLKEAIRQAGRTGRFIIVEGAPDVLRMHSDEVGLTETVATLGTAWSEQQLKQLQRYAPSLCFIPDADPPKEGEHYGPGIKAVMKNGLEAMRLGFSVSVREIPVGEDGHKQDPDSFITGCDIFNSLEDVNFAVWYGLKLLNSCSTDTERIEALKRICREALVLVEDETTLNCCLEPLYKVFGKLKLWRDAVQNSRDERRREAARREREAMSEEQAAMRELGIIVRNRCYCSYSKEGELERWSNFLMEPLSTSSTATMLSAFSASSMTRGSDVKLNCGRTSLFLSPVSNSESKASVSSSSRGISQICST